MTSLAFPAVLGLACAFSTLAFWGASSVLAAVDAATAGDALGDEWREPHAVEFRVVYMAYRMKSYEAPPACRAPSVSPHLDLPPRAEPSLRTAESPMLPPLTEKIRHEIVIGSLLESSGSSRATVKAALGPDAEAYRRRYGSYTHIYATVKLPEVQ